MKSARTVPSTQLPPWLSPPAAAGSDWPVSPNGVNVLGSDFYAGERTDGGFYMQVRIPEDIP